MSQKRLKALCLFLVGACSTSYADLTKINCKEDASAGIQSPKNGWKVIEYSPHSFSLLVDGTTLDRTSVARVLHWDAICSNGSTDPENIYCIAKNGNQLLFSLVRLKGAISNFDLVMHPSMGNDISISAFSCVPE